MKCNVYMLALILGAALHAPAAMAQTAPAPAKTQTQTYRLTYVLTTMDGSKKVGVQSYTLTADPGERARVQLSSKVPVGNETSFSYVDLGFDLSATLKELENGMEVHSDLKQSSLASGSDVSDISMALRHPVIRQAELDNTAMLQPRNRVQIGSLDIPGSTRHIEVELSLESVP